MPSGDNNRGKKHVGIPINSRPVEEARKIQSMGGIASGIAKRRKKLIKETIATILELPVKDECVREGLKRIGITSEDMTQQTLMVLGVMKRAQKGDPSAATFIRDTLGEKEADKLDLMQPVQIVIQDDYGDDDKQLSN